MRAIIELARGLRIRTTGEGVETDKQAALLRDMGCDEGQGYLYSKPVSAAHIPALVAQRNPKEFLRLVTRPAT